MVLQLEKVSRTFAGKTVVKDISLSIKRGEIVGILGTSGCGKSTLLRAVSGIDLDYDGKISINNVSDKKIHDTTGFIFQEPRLFPWQTVLENVTFGLKVSKSEAKKLGKSYLQDVGLADSERLYPSQLSGGMAQRVAIARALATSPEVLLLDEPFSALDAFTKMQLQDLLLDIWQAHQTTMVLVTHDIDEALYLCDRVIILRGQPGEISDVYTIEKQRPRERGDKYLAQLKSEILEDLDLTRQSHS
ncbi:MAG TPA: ABC transporter ATP-binding protein [Bacillota bacterium]|nr:ABC transporter ATP-binding protein [Bacillota bacterium]